MPAVSDAARHKLNRDPINDAHVILLEFQEDGTTKVERAAVNNEDVVFEGNTFVRSAVEVNMPSSGDADQSASLSISNVDRIIGRAIDACQNRISVRMIVVDTSDLTSALIDTRNLMVVPSASGNTETITATLGPRADQQEPVPFQRATRAFFPGAWIA